MKVFTNNVPSNRDDLTNGKYYEFEPESSECKYGHIVSDDGIRLFIVTEKSIFMCSHLDGKSQWEFVNE